MIPAMPGPAPQLHRYDASSYFALADEGLVAPDQKVELLDGIIVAMAPQSPLHAAAVRYVESALRDAFPRGTVIRTRLPFVAGDSSVPEPDVAVVAGDKRDYIDRHPGSALLIVEIAIATVAQDRLTKAVIYAAAGVPDYWIVHPGEEWVEVHREPAEAAAGYRRRDRFEGDSILELDGMVGVRVPCRQLFPRLAV